MITCPYNKMCSSNLPIDDDDEKASCWLQHIKAKLDLNRTKCMFSTD